MLEDSHRMLAQVTTALEEERAERIRTAGLLEHEQQRTQLLLDVLKHFREKLQGLTPQMLLSRLGGLDPRNFSTPPCEMQGAGVPHAQQPVSAPSLDSVEQAKISLVPDSCRASAHYIG